MRIVNGLLIFLKKIFNFLILMFKKFIKKLYVSLKKFFNFLILKFTKFIKKFFIFTKLENWVNGKLLYKKKCREDGYDDMILTNHCLNDILEMEAVNDSILDRSYLRSLGKILYLKYRDREVILPCDKRHFSSFSLKSFGLYMKIQDDRVVRVKRIDHIWHEEFALFTEKEQDVLSFYSHAIPVNLSKQNKILYMKYILYIEGNAWLNRAVKTLTMKTVFKVDEEVFLVNPYGEYEFRQQRRTVEPVMNVHDVPTPFLRVLIYNYTGEKDKLERVIKKISDWWEFFKKLNFYETYKHQKEEFMFIYLWILSLIGLGLVFWFSSLPYFEHMNSSIDTRWGLPIRSVYSLEPDLQLIETEKYITATFDLAEPYISWMYKLEESFYNEKFFSTTWLEYFDKSIRLKKVNYLTELDENMYFYKINHEFVMKRTRIKNFWTIFFSLNN